jgi:hypothetical protein
MAISFIRNNSHIAKRDNEREKRVAPIPDPSPVSL